MQLSALKIDELPSVKSSKNVLSLENHYSVIQEQSLLQGKACITCKEMWVVLTGGVLLLQSIGTINKNLTARNTEEGGQIVFT